MILKSNSFENNCLLPVDYTCDGEGVSPHLAWEDVPEGVQNFALECFDPDAPGEGFLHWLVINIPVQVREIARNQKAEGIELKNDYGNRGYGLPCPPKGKHRYIFTLYALDTDRLNGIKRDNYKKVLESHTLDKAVLIGQYRRK